MAKVGVMQCGILRKARRGVGLLEISLGLVIMAIGGATFAVMQNNATQAQRAQVAGETLKEVHEAARLYVQANRAALLSSVPVGGAPIAVLAGRTSPSEPVPAGSLQALGFLANTWVDRNSYGHRHVVLVRQPTAGSLAMMVTQQGGSEVRPQDLARVASRVGAAGGIVPAQAMPGAPTTRATGMGGAWAAERSEWTAGGWQPQPGRAVAFSFFPPNANETSSGTFLSRVNTGNPDDTTMQADIQLNGHNIYNGNILASNATYSNYLRSYGNIQADNSLDVTNWITSDNVFARNWVTAQHALASGWLGGQYVIARGPAEEGWGCSENGLMGRTSTGQVLTCQNGQFRRPSAAAFQELVADYYANPYWPPHTIYNNTPNVYFVRFSYYFNDTYPPYWETPRAALIPPYSQITISGNCVYQACDPVTGIGDGGGGCWCRHSYNAHIRITR